MRMVDNKVMKTLKKNKIKTTLKSSNSLEKTQLDKNV